MKHILILISLMLLAIAAQAQCEKCSSMDEALAHPDTVKNLQINPMIDDITLDSIPKTIGTLVNLEILYLTDHPFTSVPAEIGQLKKLKELSFGGCKLTELPEELFTLTQLKELVLFYNDFSKKYKKKLREKVAELMPNTKLLMEED